MAKICYNCGTPLTDEITTVEHVPAKNLYEGFSVEYKKNRITVPACSDCNNLYSKIDQEIRDVLAIKNNSIVEKQELTGKGVRSILRKSNWTDRAHFNNNGRIVAVNFNYNDLRQIHIKNFKALFFRKYGFPVPSKFQIDVIADGDDDKNVAFAQFIHNYLRFDKNFEHSGHPDIFKFILKDITPNDDNDPFYESGDFNKIVAVAGLLVYHNDIGAVILAGKQDFIDSCEATQK